MIYTALTKQAMLIAYEAHSGQKDQSGLPYIFHPLHLAEQMDDEITTCIALLHDVVEDTDVTFAQLEAIFPNSVIEPLKLLTHTPDLSYVEYVRRIKTNPVAVRVKLADIAHNSDESRFAGDEGVTEEQLAYYREKYRRALEILQS